MWITYSFYAFGNYAFGNYAYRILLNRAKECLLVSIAVSVVLGILVFLLSDVIPTVFSLTSVQYILF